MGICDEGSGLVGKKGMYCKFLGFRVSREEGNMLYRVMRCFGFIV